MARFQQLASTRAKMAAVTALASAAEQKLDGDATAELVRFAEVNARAMTPDVLHKEVMSVHEDVVRIVGEMSDDELQLKLRDLEEALAISQQRRRGNADAITTMQEEQSANLADLRRQIRESGEERDRVAEDRADELERLRQKLTAAKSKGMDADIALRKAQRELQARNAANTDALGELDEKQELLQQSESRVGVLASEKHRLEARRSTLGEAIEAVDEMLQHGAEIAAAEAAAVAEAAAAAAQEQDEDKENAGPNKDPMEQMSDMEAKLHRTCAQIQQRDAEISQLRETVTQECIQRTQLHAQLKRHGIR